MSSNKFLPGDLLTIHDRFNSGNSLDGFIGLVCASLDKEIIILFVDVGGSMCFEHCPEIEIHTYYKHI